MCDGSRYSRNEGKGWNRAFALVFVCASRKRASADTRWRERCERCVKRIWSAAELLNCAWTPSGPRTYCALLGSATTSKPHSNPTQWRMCIDYRHLNALTEAESWPLPNTEHRFERHGAKRAKFFAVMDFTQGFHQVEVYPLFRFLTAFITFSSYAYSSVRRTHQVTFCNHWCTSYQAVCDI